MTNLVELVQNDFAEKNKKELPDFRAGDSLRVHVKITEGSKTRVQAFEGTCIAIKQKNQLEGHFRVRKVAAGGVGVERVFPFFSPAVEKVEVIEKGKSRRAKHYYLRERTGKKARVAVDYSR